MPSATTSTERLGARSSTIAIIAVALSSPPGFATTQRSILITSIGSAWSWPWDE
jgi:hypothetical protein